MNDDPRCCGSGICIIDAEGSCWFGQQWGCCATAAPPGEDDNAVDVERVVSKYQN